MAIDRISGAVVTTGNAYATFKVSSADGTLSGSLLSFPIVKTNELSDETENVNEMDESNNKHAQDGARDVVWTFTHMQKDKQSLDMMVDTYRGSRLAILKQTSRNVIEHFDGNSYHTFRFAPICKVRPNLKESPGVETEAAFDVEALPALTTYDISEFDDGSFDSTLTGSIGMAKGAYHTLITLAAKS